MDESRPPTSPAASPTEIASEDTSPADIPTTGLPLEDPTVVPPEEPTLVPPVPPAESPPPLPEGSPPAVEVEPVEPDAVGTLLETALRDVERISSLLGAVPGGEPAGGAPPSDERPADAGPAAASSPSSTPAPAAPPASPSAPSAGAVPTAPPATVTRGPHTDRFNPDPNNPNEMRLRRLLDSKNRREEGRKARKKAKAKAKAAPSV